ncbi:MAG: DUF4838 domain-containing protein [Victivallales bacterium]|nr:DUF4838 domain-containing protein [Victivallales bacterium]
MMKPACCFLLVLAVTLGASEVLLVKQGAPQCVIVKEAPAEPFVRLAARELAEHLRLRTGAEIPVLPPDQPVPEGAIPVYLGLSERTRSLGVDEGRLAPGGFLLKVTPQYVIIAGRDHAIAKEPFRGHPFIYCRPKLDYYSSGERGTLNGVCRTLRDHAGIRHYMWGELGAVIPQSPDFALPLGERYEAPAFRYRHFAPVWYRDAQPEGLAWLHRLCTSWYDMPFINHSFFVMHRLKDTHPEYFALIDGQRDFDNLSTANHFGNLCLTNPEGIRAFADFISRFFDRHPDLAVYPVVPQDGLHRICECPDCQKLLSPQLGPNGRHSDAVFHFVAEIAKEVAKRHPDKFVGALAYERYRMPPTFQLPPNVLVQICYRRQDLRRPERKAEIEGVIREFRKRGVQVMVWTYPLFNHIPPSRGVPLLYSGILQENLRFLRDQGVLGEKSEASYCSGGGDQDVHGHVFALPASTHLNDYVRTQLLWNPDLDVMELLEEYYTLFYGPAAAPMREFWQLAERLFLEHGEFERYTADDFHAFQTWLEKAAELPPEKSIYRSRVQLLQNELAPYFKLFFTLKERMPVITATIAEAKHDFTGAEQGTGRWTDTPLHRLIPKSGRELRLDEPATTARMVAADDGLAIQVIAQEPDMGSIVAKCTQRDARSLWKDDCLELFLLTEDRSLNRHYIVNTLGAIFDIAQNRDIGLPGDVNWTGGLQARIEKRTDSWVANLLVPWGDLGAETRESVPPLRIQLYRRRTGGDAANGEYYCLTPVNDQHNYSALFFPALRFLPLHNRLANPSFEVLDKEGALIGWRTAEGVVSQQGSADGTRHITIAAPAGAKYRDARSLPVSVSPDTEYLLRFRHRGSTGFAYVMFFNAEGKHISEPEHPFWGIRSTAEWTMMQVRGRVPANAVAAAINFRNFKTTPPANGTEIDAVEFFVKP